VQNRSCHRHNISTLFWASKTVIYLSKQFNIFFWLLYCSAARAPILSGTYTVTRFGWVTTAQSWQRGQGHDKYVRRMAKRRGWQAIGLKAMGLALADQTCWWVFLLLLAARDRVPQQRSATAMKARGLALADLTCLWLFSCCLPRATKYHSNKRRALRISRHFCTLSRTLPCNKPCLLSTAACLLPPTATTCYICCRRRGLLCEN